MKQPTLEEVIAFFKDKGIDNVEYATLCFDYYDCADWHDRNGEPVKSWKQKVLINWIKREKDRIKNTAPAIKLRSVNDILDQRKKYGN